MIQVQIAFFGQLTEVFGRQVFLECQPSECTVGELRKILADRYPASSADMLSPKVRACINDRLAADTETIRPEDAIAFLPPVSGG